MLFYYPQSIFIFNIFLLLLDAPLTSHLYFHFYFLLAFFEFAFAFSCSQLETISLYKTSQSPKNKYHMSSVMRNRHVKYKIDRYTGKHVCMFSHLEKYIIYIIHRYYICIIYIEMWRYNAVWILLPKKRWIPSKAVNYILIGCRTLCSCPNL